MNNTNPNPRPQPIYVVVDTPTDRLFRWIICGLLLSPLLSFVLLCVCAQAEALWKYTHPEQTTLAHSLPPDPPELIQRSRPVSQHEWLETPPSH
jgi:hypothetical protein